MIQPHLPGPVSEPGSSGPVMHCHAGSAVGLPVTLPKQQDLFNSLCPSHICYFKIFFFWFGASAQFGTTQQNYHSTLRSPAACLVPVDP